MVSRPVFRLRQRRCNFSQDRQDTSNTIVCYEHQIMLDRLSRDPEIVLVDTKRRCRRVVSQLTGPSLFCSQVAWRKSVEDRSTKAAVRLGCVPIDGQNGRDLLVNENAELGFPTFVMRRLHPVAVLHFADRHGRHKEWSGVRQIRYACDDGSMFGSVPVEPILDHVRVEKIAVQPSILLEQLDSDGKRGKHGLGLLRCCTSAEFARRRALVLLRQHHVQRHKGTEPLWIV